MPARIPKILMQRAAEGAARPEMARLRPRRDRGGDRPRDVVVDLVVLLAAQTRRQADLEDEELAGERGRVEVIRQPRAVAHGEAPQVGTAREQPRHPRLELLAQLFLVPL